VESAVPSPQVLRQNNVNPEVALEDQNLMAEQSKADALESWFLQEFGDIVEIV
jgi:hypothetical protein